MPRNGRSEHLRYRYGLCLNDQCSKCKSKEVQQLAARKDFVCEECGKQLREVAPPKTTWEKYGKFILGGVGAVVVAGGVVLALSLGGEDPKPTKEQGQSPVTAQIPVEGNDSVKQDTAKVDTVKSQVPEAPKVSETLEAKQPKASQTSARQTAAGSSKSGTTNLGYATYTGPIQGGKPHGVGGRLVFKSSHVIDSKDPKGRVAEAGDYVLGEFANGHLVQGKWYGADNVVKGSILIGM